MKIVALCGRARAGKNEASKHLGAEHCGGGWRDIAFADPLKDMVCILLGITREQMADPDLKEKIRPWLVNLGGDIRDRDPYAWVAAACRTIDRDLVERQRIGDDAEKLVYFIPDLRYFNELHRLLEHYGSHVRAIRVSAELDTIKERMGEANFKRYVDSGICRDSSETQLGWLDTLDCKIHPDLVGDVRAVRTLVQVIPNNGALHDFQYDLDGAWKLMMSPDFEFDPSWVSRACYRLARKMGPEAKLMV